MTQTKTLARSAIPDLSSLGMDLKERIKNLPLPMQVFVNLGFAGLLLLDVVILDPLPLLDELLIGWLLFTGVSGTASSIRERRGTAGALPAAVDVRDQQVPPELDDELLTAAAAEVEALEGVPF